MDSDGRELCIYKGGRGEGRKGEGVKRFTLVLDMPHIDARWNMVPNISLSYIDVKQPQYFPHR